MQKLMNKYLHAHVSLLVYVPLFTSIRCLVILAVAASHLRE